MEPLVTDTHLDDLTAALSATPDNQALRAIVVRLLLDSGRFDEARARVAEVDSGVAIEAPLGLLFARVWLESGEPERVLALLAHGDEHGDAEARMLRARALADLHRLDEARSDYEAAVAANVALEDHELKRRLGAKVTAFPGRGGGPALKVIANDDTDADDLLRLLEPASEAVSFADVAGLQDVKKSIHRKIILPFQKPGLFQRFRKRIGGGILLYGPPGCGKTLLARATAGEADASFFNISIADVLDMYIGESERKLHAIFEKARQSAPAVMFFDEIEALGGKRQFSREGTSAKVVSQFLAEMDGFSRDNHGVLVLGATNVPWAIDPAFRRPGRFDRVQFVPPPDREARVAMLRLLLARRPGGDDIDVGPIAKGSSGFSGADLLELVETAADEAIEASIDAGRELPMTRQHLRNALKERRATTVEWLTTARNYARYANEGGQYDEVLAFLDRHGTRGSQGRRHGL